MRIVIVAAALLLAAGSAFACRFDTDCAVGSRCAKQGYNLDGVCMGGMKPGNQFDRRPYHDRLDTSRSVGRTCQFNTDCGVGAVCMKESGQLRGTCMR